MTPSVIIATGNSHKVREIAAILGSEYRCLAMSELGTPPPLIESGNTFEANAAMKCEQVRDWLVSRPIITGGHGLCHVLADDSGLEVDALQGAPGVRSARFASVGGGNATDEANNRKLLALMREVSMEKRSARFRCVLASIPFPEGALRFFEGSCEGSIATTCRGASGFGYDPVFIPEGSRRTFAEMGAALKDRFSHRARALAQLADWLGRKSEVRQQ